MTGSADPFALAPVGARLTSLSSIGDPASDFAAQRYLGAAFAAGVLDGYRSSGGHVDKGLGRRIRRRWEVREFSGIRTALELGDEDELEEGLAKLRAGPVLSQT